MTKAKWVEHMMKTTGICPPSNCNGDTIVIWKNAHKKHLDNKCPECLNRMKTYRANEKKKMVEQAYRDCGLTKVRGAVSGKIYWE